MQCELLVPKEASESVKWFSEAMKSGCWEPLWAAALERILLSRAEKELRKLLEPPCHLPLAFFAAGSSSEILLSPTKIFQGLGQPLPLRKGKGSGSFSVPTSKFPASRLGEYRTEGLSPILQLLCALSCWRASR